MQAIQLCQRKSRMINSIQRSRKTEPTRQFGGEKNNQYEVKTEITQSTKQQYNKRARARKRHLKENVLYKIQRESRQEVIRELYPPRFVTGSLQNRMAKTTTQPWTGRIDGIV